MSILLRSPHPFPERLLLFAGGGGGKTEALLQIARHIATGHVHVYENDISFAWDRALATTFSDVDAAKKVTVEHATGEWEHTLDTISDLIAAADADDGDWIMLDSMTPTWEQVRSWFLQKVYGADDAGSHMLKLKAQYADDLEGYAKALANTLNYDIINKEYNRLYNLLFSWKGNLAVTAEAQAIGSREGAEEQMIFGHLGFKPAGQKRLHYIASTNVFLVHKTRDTWLMSTAKDRNREDLEGEQVEDFAVDYLVKVAGWKVVKS